MNDAEHKPTASGGGSEKPRRRRQPEPGAGDRDRGDAAGEGEAVLGALQDEPVAANGAPLQPQETAPAGTPGDHQRADGAVPGGVADTGEAFGQPLNVGRGERLAGSEVLASRDAVDDRPPLR